MAARTGAKATFNVCSITEKKRTAKIALLGEQFAVRNSALYMEFHFGAILYRRAVSEEKKGPLWLNFLNMIMKKKCNLTLK